MHYSIPINWCESSKILSGNVAIENLIVSNPLPDGFFWLVVIRDGRAEFRWNRKVSIRGSGKGQITLGGKSGFSCELVTAKISRGCKVQIVIAKGSRQMVQRPSTPREGILPKKGSLSIPFPVRRETLGEDVKAYRGMANSTIQWVRVLGWGETIKAAKFSGAFTAALKFQTMVSTKSGSMRQYRFEELERMGVVMDLPTFE